MADKAVRVLSSVIPTVFSTSVFEKTNSEDYRQFIVGYKCIDNCRLTLSVHINNNISYKLSHFLAHYFFYFIMQYVTREDL